VDCWLLDAFELVELLEDFLCVCMMKMIKESKFIFICSLTFLCCLDRSKGFDFQAIFL